MRDLLTLKPKEILKMSTEKQYAVELTGAEWAKICGVLFLANRQELLKVIEDQLPYLSDEVLDTFNQ